MGTHVRWKTLLGLGAVAVVVLSAAGFWSRGAAPSVPPSGEDRGPAPSGRGPAALAPPIPMAAPPGPVASGGEEAVERFLPVPEPTSSEETRSEYPVNLERLRERLPGNLYWEVGAPTRDPQVLQKRAEAERSRNALFGKVQAGDASEEEIHRYYDFRRQLSEDYIAFAALMLSEHGEQLPERDRGLLELSIQMHRDRLKALPQQRKEALARKLAQDKRREAWHQQGGPGN